MGTDEFGRVESLLAAGERETTVSVEGYQSRSVTMKCEEGRDVYQEIVLEHK
jgi:hypothetical protein